jgi:hypothetical protein
MVAALLATVLALVPTACGRVAEISVGRVGASAGGEGGGAPACTAAGSACSDGLECCSGSCEAGTCAASLFGCDDVGSICTSSLDCCSLSCASGECAAFCISDGEVCESSEECCGGDCQEGACQPLTTSCFSAGNRCDDSEDCCSGLCSNGLCSLGSSYCVQVEDICGGDSDCCSGNCQIESGMTLGRCGDVPMGASNCSGVAGTVCGECNECCSRLCAPFGDSGVSICQAAGGCRLTGELCSSDLDCCGGDPMSELPGAGNVVCDVPVGSSLGVCRNAMGCSPQGNVCHLQDYACKVSAAPNNCCDGEQAGTCELDRLGVPRCSGIAACRELGETCSSAVDCCEGLPCTADDDGVFRCQAELCEPQGAPCTVNADCCVPLRCQQGVGETRGQCGDSDDTATCTEFGQLCDVDEDCCGNVPCLLERCQYPVR